MPRLKLTIEYDGTGYVGWQRQAQGKSVQGAMEKALTELLGSPTEVLGAGRTDSGVHALGQVVSFFAAQSLPLKAYTRGLNGILPKDISVRAAAEVPTDFDPRRWASGKRYRYRVSNLKTRSALRRNTHWEIFASLNVERMEIAGRGLVGRHDFSAFRASDCQAHHAIRELRSVSVQQADADEILFDVDGTAFLKHMVRNIVGSLLEVGKGRQETSWMEELLRSKDRTKAGPTAPAHGLTLLEVQYGNREMAKRDNDDEE